MNDGPAPAAKIVKCPSCASSITLRGLGRTSTLACSSCRAVIDISGDEFKILQQEQSLAITPVIALGSRGTLKGVLFEVIGFLVRSDGSGQYQWGEYLLFNPYHGFRWLVEANGHWNFVTPLTTAPEPPSGFGHPAIPYEKRRYKHFLAGRAVVRFVLGEFYWLVKAGDTVDVSDYICPPYILSMERDQSEENWAHGEYLPVEELSKAFPDAGPWPFSSGVSANQPAPGSSYRTTLSWYTLYFAVAIIAVHLFVAATARRELIISNSYNFNRTFASGNTIVTEPFELRGVSRNLQLVAEAPVDNSWISLDVSLVKADGSEFDDAVLEVAYYHGSDSDGSWSEGGRLANVVLPSVPAGNYYLRIDHTADPGWSITSIPYKLTVRRDVPYNGNMVVGLLLALMPTGLMWVIKLFFENRRWQESDYGSSEE